MKTNKKNDTEQFINHFHELGSQDVSVVFTRGCCYWFSYIMCGRFPDAKMVYDPVANHFCTERNGRIYDITGDVTGQYQHIEDWDTYPAMEKKRIERFCRDF